MKKCFKCDKIKALSHYYKHPATKDGFLNKCKTCAKNDATKHRNENIEKVRACDRLRGNRYTGEKSRIYREKNPVKYNAQMKLNNAVKYGLLTRSKFCENCNSTEFIHGHHCDYSKIFDVMWLCVRCHVDWHKKNKAING